MKTPAVALVSKTPSIFSYYNQIKLIRTNEYKNVKVVSLLSSSTTRNDVIGSNEILNCIYSYNRTVLENDRNAQPIVIGYDKFKKMFYNCLQFDNIRFIETFYKRNKESGEQSNLLMDSNQEMLFNSENYGITNQLNRILANYDNEEMFLRFLKMGNFNKQNYKDIALNMLQFQLGQSSNLSEFWMSLDTYFSTLFEFEEGDFIFLIHDHYSRLIFNYEDLRELFNSTFYNLKSEKTQSMFLNYFVKYFYLSKNGLFNLNMSSNFFMKLILIENSLVVHNFQNLELNFLKCCLNTDFGYHSAIQILKYLISKDKLRTNIKYYQFFYRIFFRKFQNLKKAKSAVLSSSIKQVNDTIIYLIRKQLLDFTYIDPTSQFLIQQNTNRYLSQNIDSLKINEKQILEQPLIVNHNDLYNFEKRSRYNFEKLFKC